ncbi:MAG: hypothetical protein ACJ04Q_11660 [Flavobacteriales bacterium]
MENFHSKSSILSLLFRLKFFDILTPWHFDLNFTNHTIEISKRNWYLIGVDNHLVAFKYIRSLSIDEHLIGGNIKVKVTGGNVLAECLPKTDCHKIKGLLIDYNNRSKKHIVMH